MRIAQGEALTGTCMGCLPEGSSPNWRKPGIRTSLDAYQSKDCLQA